MKSRLAGIMISSTSSTSHPFLATCPRGLEQLLSDELGALGAEVGSTTVAGVGGEADLAALYRACLWSRLANRVILRLCQVEGVESAETLLDVARGIDWAAHLAPGATLRVDFHGHSEGIRHTRFGAQTIKDAVVERMVASGAPRPAVDLEQPGLRIYAHLHRGRLTLGIDLSGDSLHLRGYRREGGKAPLKENLAAALLIRAGWPERAALGEVLIDPLCGSGTLLIEGALIAADMAPNLKRTRFGFHGWLGHDEAVWRQVLEEAQQRASQGRARLRSSFIGQDADALAIEAAGANARRAGVDAWLTLSRGDVARLEAPAGEAQGLVITNPPYGERIGDIPALIPLYAAIGERMRSQFPGWRLALFTGNPELGHRTGLKAHKQYALRNGQLECKLLLIDVYAGGDERRRSNAEGEDEPRGPSEGARMFANRLEKNRKRLAKWLKRSGVSCYRLYDADMPEYALAIDIYAGRVHVQEYAPPRSIDPSHAERRLMEALGILPEVLGVASDRIYLKRRQRQSGKAQYQRQSDSKERLQVEEEGAKLWVNLRDYLDTGLFLDHRPVRRRLREMAAGKRFLNLFCYTASATVHAALGGARESVSVDMSNTYLEWAQDNFRLNKLDLRRHRLERADCLEWLGRERGYFDLIFLDPPTFSNSKKMSATLDVQRDHPRLVEAAMARLAPSGTLLFSNNQRRFVLEPGLEQRFEVEEISRATLDPDFQRRPEIHHAYLIRLRQ